MKTAPRERPSTARTGTGQSHSSRKSLLAEAQHLDDTLVEVFKRFRGERAELIPVLQAAQNAFGYLPYFVPIVANYHRTRIDFGGLRPLPPDGYTRYLPYFAPLIKDKGIDEARSTSLDSYFRMIEKYKKMLIKGVTAHRFRSGDGRVLPNSFRRRRLLLYGILKYTGKKLPGR